MVQNFGELIRSTRISKGLSERELAYLCSAHDTDIHKLETNKIKKPSIKLLIAMSKALEINLLAAFLEDDYIFYTYKSIIDKCAKLDMEKLKQLENYIDTLINVN